MAGLLTRKHTSGIEFGLQGQELGVCQAPSLPFSPQTLQGACEDPRERLAGPRMWREAGRDQAGTWLGPLRCVGELRYECKCVYAL